MLTGSQYIFTSWFRIVEISVRGQRGESISTVGRPPPFEITPLVTDTSPSTGKIFTYGSMHQRIAKSLSQYILIRTLLSRFISPCEIYLFRLGLIYPHKWPVCVYVHICRALIPPTFLLPHRHGSHLNGVFHISSSVPRLSPYPDVHAILRSCTTFPITKKYIRTSSGLGLEN